MKQEKADLEKNRDLAKKIWKNSKGEALLIAFKKGFEMAAELGAKRKAIIFTESRITQDYLVRLLSENGYENKIVLFNGSNNDEKSKEIFQEWMEKNRDSDKITGSKTADKRAAIVDYFKDEAEIMIATEAGAEGVNLQFCSLLINYDLPWNPQRIEQRIGRCHRYGQKYDVVVINFVNRKNAADQRVYELLDQKFSLFKCCSLLKTGTTYRGRSYKSNKKPSIEDELENREPLTQVGRALKELGVDVIFAHSAQAKGRVERLFRTFQDRLVKEMRLRKIRSIEEANSFLKEYLPVYNKRFSVPAAKSADLHRPLPKGIDLDIILCKKTERALRNDFTVAHDKKLYQVENNIRVKKVTVEERINGSMLIRHKNIALKFKEITVRPEKTIQLKPSRPYVFPNRAHTPAANHPWRIRCINPQYSQYEQKEKVDQKEKELLLTVT